jgi:glyoxylase-like metal-dependent hydrolase (beta-lactamase superfamily II)
MTNGKKVAENIYLIDARVFGIPNFTSAYLIAGEKLALIETGPTKSVPFIIEGIKRSGFDPGDVSYLVVTHIHLDHGGGAGTLLREIPDAKVVVHEKGARHMIDPSKLVNSSKRVFGDFIDEWYGEVLPVEQDRIMPVKGGEIIDLGKGQRLRMIDSPGHSNHHICIYSEKEKGLFTGDAVGVYLSDSGRLIPTTPPPEFDPDVNVETIKGFLGLDLKLLLFSHFGVTEKVNQTLNTSIDWLMKWKESVSEMMSKGLHQEEITEKFRADSKETLGSNKGNELLTRWVMEHHIPMCAMGYFNYFKKKDL